MNMLQLLEKYDISVTSRCGAVQDVARLRVPQQRKLLRELLLGLDFEYPNKKYLIELTLKYLVDDIVTNQITSRFVNLGPYKRAVNKAKKMGKESLYAQYVLAGQKSTRKKRKGA